MDETGQPGGAAPEEDGNAAGSYADQPRPANGFAGADPAWSDAAALDQEAEPVRPSWQQPAEVVGARAWADPSSRYAELLPPFAAPAPARETWHTNNGVSYRDRRSGELHPSDPQAGDPGLKAARFPASAPPYPFEGDLEDATRERPAIPLPRSAPPADGPTERLGPPATPALPGAEPAETAWRRFADSDPAEVLPPPVHPRWRPAGDPTPASTPPGTPTPTEALANRSDPATARGGDHHESGRPAPGAADPATSGRVRPALPADDEPRWPAGHPGGAAHDATNPWAPNGAAPGVSAPSGRGGEGPDAPRNSRRGAPDGTPSWTRPASSGGADRAARNSGDDWSPGWSRRTSAGRPDDETTRPPYGPSGDPPGPRAQGGRAGAADFSAASIPAAAASSDEPPPVGPANRAAVGSTYAGPADPNPAAFTSDTLPQRVPAEPDVPTVPEPPAVAPPAETPELTRIATHLRRDDPSSQAHERPEGFDVNAILAAVRGVAGVRDASLRTAPSGAHSLRLDLADGADPAEVSRHVARLLQERMGLAAAPQNLPGGAGARSSSAPPHAANQAAPSQSGGRWPANAGGSAQPETAAPRRRRQSAHRGRATEEEIAAPAFPDPGAAAGIIGSVGGSPVTAAAYSGGQVSTTETTPSRPLSPGERPGPRVVIDHVQVSTFGMDATVEVRLAAGRQRAAGLSTGPAVDGYVLRLCAAAAASAVDELLQASERVVDRGRCFVEHAAVVPLGSCEVAVVVVLLVCGGWVEQLVGSALVAGDPRQAVVRATLAAVNRRLEALLS